jgi:hypothetical protein
LNADAQRESGATEKRLAKRGLKYERGINSNAFGNGAKKF